MRLRRSWRQPVTRVSILLQPDPPSPCVSICRLDTAGNCTGCFRTVEEIAAWSTMNNQDKHRVLARIKPMLENTDSRDDGSSS
ncbi:MAG: DUF1289 domain-containing protein [Burkholderiaceae bacterium]